MYQPVSRVLLGVAQDRVSANDENAPHIAVALFRDRPELLLAAGRVLARHEPDPGREVTTRAEPSRSASRPSDPGEEQNAALARAVIGGLLFATPTTLLVVPYLFAMLRKGNDGIETVGKIDCFEQRQEPFFLDEQNGTEAAVRTTGDNVAALERRLLKIDFRYLILVSPHPESTEPDLVVSVRLTEMAAVVKHYIPVDAMLLDVVGQQCLSKILDR